MGPIQRLAQYKLHKTATKTVQDDSNKTATSRQRRSTSTNCFNRLTLSFQGLFSFLGVLSLFVFSSQNVFSFLLDFAFYFTKFYFGLYQCPIHSKLACMSDRSVVNLVI